SAPRMSDMSAELAQLFLRAFAREGTINSRPSAHDWIKALDGAARTLKACSTDQSHHHFSNSTTCPWCRVEGMVGLPMFGYKIQVGPSGAFDLTKLWTAIDAIQPPADSKPIPDSESFKAGCSVNPEIGMIKRERR